MTRITGKHAMIYISSPDRETCLGLKLPGEMREIEVSEMEISWSYGLNDITNVSFAERLPDASGEFTGYFDKD